MSDFRTHEAEKADKKPGKKRRIKRPEPLEGDIEEEAGEEVEGGWEKVKGGAPLVKVKEYGAGFCKTLLNKHQNDSLVIYIRSKKRVGKHS